MRGHGHRGLCLGGALRPSYRERFERLAIAIRVDSQWLMHPHKDLAAHVRRISDGKEFRLGLSEIKAVAKGSPNHLLLDDYAIWFVNEGGL